MIQANLMISELAELEGLTGAMHNMGDAFSLSVYIIILGNNYIWRYPKYGYQADIINFTDTSAWSFYII